jgi:hypothetical protein
MISPVAGDITRPLDQLKGRGDVLGYPSTKPVPNSAVATLSKGQRVKITKTRYEKDFMYDEVVLAAGSTGHAPLLGLRSGPKETATP